MKSLHKTTQIIATLSTWAVIAIFADQIVGEELAKSGIEKRIPWTTSRIKGSPERPLPYVTERAFPALKFNQCLDIATPPGGDRIFVAEQSGKIFSFVPDQNVQKADLVVDVRQISGVQNVYAFTFHPEFQTNRYCYVCYIKGAGREDGTHVARFTLSDTNPPTIDVASEKTIITWLAGGHNGCCLKFGPDGYLYISTGDGVGPNPPDTKRTGQDISDLLSSILRIDVDGTESERNYRIPDDNPFVQLAGARGEIWAYGFRNPWRMSFDRKSGDLWVGDVGWELWELLDRVERGGNFGWGVMEGRQSTNPEWPRGPTPILPPTIDHPHSESSSITDGLTYYGNRLKELHGCHIYGDYDTGKIWTFRFRNGQVTEHREIADTTHRIVGFGEDNLGEIYLLDHTAGTIHILASNPNQNRQDDFPRKLSESGLFSSVKDLVPAPGVISYSINAEPWHDYAIAERFVAIPKELSMNAEPQIWQLPKDSVLVKNLSLDMKHGQPETRRRIETQVLHFDGSGWQTYTYEWNDEQTEAILLGSAGKERTFDIVDSTSPGGLRKQTWTFSGRAECQRCHNRWSGPALALNTPQLNKDHNYGDQVASQLATFAHIKLIAKPIAGEGLPKLSDPEDTDAGLSARARAYLHVNCAHCHRMHAGSSVLSKMHYDLPLERTDMLGMRPTQGTFGIHSAQVISPGDPFGSVLLYRMSKLGGGRMPHIGSSEIDRAGAKLIHDWIRQISLSDDKSEISTVAEIRKKEVADLRRLESVKDEQDQALLVDRLLSSTSGALMLQRSVVSERLPQHVASVAVAKATQHEDVSIRDLFEPFLPPEKRIKRLGSIVQPEKILALPGNVDHGKQVFFNTSGVQCKNCHRIDDKGEELGPDLTTIGKKLTRAKILENILEPSKTIEPKYVTYIAETVDGLIHTGLLVKKGSDEVILKDAQNKEIRIPASQIEQLVPQQRSLMPDLLLRDMTSQQVADLLAFLSELK